jgi:hypothetical protein
MHLIMFDSKNVQTESRAFVIVFKTTTHFPFIAYEEQLCIGYLHNMKSCTSETG